MSSETMVAVEPAESGIAPGVRRAAPRLAVEARGLSKSYRIPAPGRPTLADHLRRPRWAMRQPRWTRIDALRELSFDVREGEVFGIIGRNGAGKSTLLKILSRITTPTSGQAIVRGRVASLLEVGTGFHPELTGRENIYLNGMLLGMRAGEVDRVLDTICEFAGIGPYLNVPIKRYSSGMQLRLAFSVAAHLAADTMIIDEVLAVGDAEFQEKCTTAMHDASARGRTTLFVSHNMAAVEHLCDRVMLLQRGRPAEIGAPRDMIRGYLRGAGAAGTEAREYVAPADRAADAPVRIMRVRADGPGGGTPVQGEDLVVTLELAVAERIRRLQVLVSIGTADGQRLMTTCNADQGTDWDVERGLHRVTVSFDAARLTPQAYRVSVMAFLDRGAEMLDEIADAVTFTVQGRDVLGTGVMLLADRGPTYAPTRFAIEPLVDRAP